MIAPRVELPQTYRGDFGRRPVLANHNLHEHELFSDAALIELLDRFPREHLYALTMGNDDTRTDGNRLALHDGCSRPLQTFAISPRAVTGHGSWSAIASLSRRPTMIF